MAKPKLTERPVVDALKGTLVAAGKVPQHGTLYAANGQHMLFVSQQPCSRNGGTEDQGQVPEQVPNGMARRCGIHAEW